VLGGNPGPHFIGADSTGWLRLQCVIGRPDLLLKPALGSPLTRRKVALKLEAHRRCARTQRGEDVIAVTMRAVSTLTVVTRMSRSITFSLWSVKR
jgi:hypothetical protein